MNAKQIVLMLFIAVGLGCILFFTFEHFKKEEARMLENASYNKMQEELDRKEKENQKEQEEKKKQEAGQKQVKELLEKLQETKQIVLARVDESGELDTFDTLHKYRKEKEILEESVIKEIVDCFANAVWEANKNTNFLEKLWQFYDNQENIILEYDGHSFITKDGEVFIHISTEKENKLNGYFAEE